MARRNDKEIAITLRLEGMSYSQIQEHLHVGKSTLSGWLSDMPLSRTAINQLRAHSEVRIEKFRNTMMLKRARRLSGVFSDVSKEIGVLSDREFFIAGYFLYWAEGAKTTPYSITLSNTDPFMIRAYLKWLKLIKVPAEKLIIKLHLYADMDVKKETEYWVKELNISKTNFRKPYIKTSKLSDLTYITKGHGTCNVIVHNRDFAEKVHQGLQYIQRLYN
jgi:hypothetical protein